jgi:hypothetical protein
MYSRETRVLLRHYLEQGVGKSELATRFGVSRRTVYHWIETGQLERDLDDEVVGYKPRPTMPRKLDPYKGIVQARLQMYPRLTAQRVFEEVRADGYIGGYTQIKEYVRQVRAQAPDDLAVQRFETPAGFQGSSGLRDVQLSWGSALRAGRRAGLQAHSVAEVLRASKHAGPIRRPRGRIQHLRWCAAGVIVRPDARCGHRR